MRISALLSTTGVLLIGAVTYVIYKYYQNRNSNNMTNNIKTEKRKSASVVSDVEKVHSDAEKIILSEFEKTQSEVSNSIRERHSASSQYIKDILNETVNDNEEFDKTINQVNDNLDNLLK